jgi:hypothetical protein
MDRDGEAKGKGDGEGSPEKSCNQDEGKSHSERGDR